jgi:colicin import membrane protein
MAAGSSTQDDPPGSDSQRDEPECARGDHGRPAGQARRQGEGRRRLADRQRDPRARGPASAELAESDREARIERDREEAERKAERDKAEAAAKAEQERQREQQSVATLEKSADAVKTAAETEAEKLEREAKLAEARANAIDPEETR